MKFKPSLLEQKLASLPVDLQIAVLNAIADDQKKPVPEAFNPLINAAAEFGKQARKYQERIYLNSLKGGFKGL
jgi:hypothetical protein